MCGIERLLLKVELVAYAIAGGIESVSHSSKGEITMSALKKLMIKTVSRQTVLSLAEIRRKKMVSKIEEQQALLESVLRGQEFKVTRQRVTRDAAGAKVRHTVDRQVKAWWFAQGAGAGAAVFVQAKYGTKVIALSGAGNSVQVATVGDVAAVLAAIKDAVVGGELDNAISAVISARKVMKTRSVK